MDIILVDETHSAAVRHIIPDADNDVGADKENSAPAFMHHGPFTHPLQFSLVPNDTVYSGHTGFTSFHTPASSFSNSHEPYHSALFYLLIRSCSPSSSSSPPFLNNRQYRLLSDLSIGDVNLNFDRTHNYTGTIHQ